MGQFVWILVAAVVVSLALQGVLLHVIHRRQLAVQQAVLQRTQQALSSRLEKTKHQIGQLQIDLSEARQQLKRAGRESTAVHDRSPARQALERELDDAPATRSSLPIDGFADTQPSAQDTQYGNLLLQ